MKRVTGLGGIFFKCQDPKALSEWYKTHLGFDVSPYGTKLGADTAPAYTLWTPFPATTTYLEPSSKEFMINYRVENLEWLVEQLQRENVTVLDQIATYDYGKFVHILDPEGNKIELWEPAGE